AAEFRQLGEAHDLIGGGTALTGGVEIGIVQAGEHRDRDDLHLRVYGAGFFGGRAHHRFAAAGVDVEDSSAQPGYFARRSADRVRDVVEFGVGKDRQTDGDDRADRIGAERRHELEADLEAADIRLDRVGNGQSFCEIGGVESDENGIGARHREAVISRARRVGKLLFAVIHAIVQTLAQFLAGAKERGAFFFYSHRFAGARVSSHARRTDLDRKRAESAKFHAVAV